MSYVDGFLITLPKKNLSAYKEMATVGAEVWMEHGALDYKECVIEDPTPEMTQLTFGKLTQAKEDETLIFAYILFKSREHRDEVNARVMADPRMNEKNWEEEPMPFEMDRFSYAGFDVLVDGKPE